MATITTPSVSPAPLPSPSPSSSGDERVTSSDQTASNEQQIEQVQPATHSPVSPTRKTSRPQLQTLQIPPSPATTLKQFNNNNNNNHTTSTATGNKAINGLLDEDKEQAVDISPRVRQNTVAANGLGRSYSTGSGTGTPYYTPHNNNNLTPNNPSPSPDENESGDQFDALKDLSPHSPRSISSNPLSNHHQTPRIANSVFQPALLSTVPDIINNIDRSLLPIIAPFNFLDPSTWATRLSALNITKASYLLKRQSQPMLGGHRYRYNKRYLLLKDNQLSYDSSKKEIPLKGGMDLRYVEAERGEEDQVLWLTVSQWWKHNGKYEKQPMKQRMMEWRCENLEEREEWMRVIEESKMMHEVYPLCKGDESTPFPIALVLGLPASGKSTVFKHIMAWRSPAAAATIIKHNKQANKPINTTATLTTQPQQRTTPQPALTPRSSNNISKKSIAEDEDNIGPLSTSVSFSSFSPRIGEQVTHTKASHHHRYDFALEEDNGYMPIETRISWKKRIFLHILTGLSILGDEIDEHSVDTEFLYSKTVLEDEKTKLTANEDENITLDRHTIEYMQKVWKEPLVQQTLDLLKNCNPWCKTLLHFISKIDSMCLNDWIPSFLDVYYCYQPLSIMSWKQVDPHSPHRFRVYDIGGSAPLDRVERWKLERFIKASFVIFTVDLNSYDQSSTVDPQLTLLQESLLLYQQLLLNKTFLSWGPITVYFTNVDLMTQKLINVPFKEKIPQYEGDNDLTSVIRCIMGMFAKIGGDRYAGRVVCGIDRLEMKKALSEDIEKRRLQRKKMLENKAQS